MMAAFTATGRRAAFSIWAISAPLKSLPGSPNKAIGTGASRKRMEGV
jgi:hypothetical protein